jgi:hypothetical protein
MFKKKQPPQEALKGFEHEMNIKSLSLGRDAFEKKECERRIDFLDNRMGKTMNEMKEITDKWAKVDMEEKAKAHKETLKVVKNDVENTKV